MDTQDIMNILLAGLGVVITGLCSWLTAFITKWLNSKIKDKKLANYLSQITEICTSSVKVVYQTYVESIKGTDKWTKEAQEKALSQALQEVKLHLSDEVKKFIEDNYGDLTAYLKSQIESILYNLKNK